MRQVICRQILKGERKERVMKRIVTIETRDLMQSALDGGCGECQTSCQSASKTSCAIANQKCAQDEGPGGSLGSQ